MGQERSLCIVISQYKQVSYMRYGTWLDEMAIPNMAALREGGSGGEPPTSRAVSAEHAANGGAGA